jgi:5-methylcytosine-specific restriction endonuclease McrA
MKTHHAQVHDESLAGFEKECKNCGDTFIAPQQSRKYCEQSCAGKDLFNGEDNPCYRDAKTTTHCKQCGDEYEVWEKFKDESTFCSKDCQATWRSNNLRGEDHPAWKGGWEEYYGPHWEEQRQKCLERDEYECRACGMSQAEHHEQFGTGLNVHHVIPHREFESTEAANDVGNLVAACSSCHSRYEGLPVFPV